MNNLKKAFGNKRIIGLAGMKSTGKTNNLIYLLKEFREKDKITPVYVYGIPEMGIKYLTSINIKEISSLRHLVKKKNSLLIVDEFQKLNLNDRRYKDALNEFVDFVYHNNIWVILSSPNIREFNSVIGGIIERWLLKDVRADQCINGSQLKNVVDEYKGRCKHLGTISVEVDKLLVIDDEEETVINCKYVKEVDNKKDQKSIF